MSLPVNPGRLSAVTGFVPWRKAVERILSDHDARLSRTDAGTAVVWLGGAMPVGLLAANGAIVNRADYPRLFDRIGTTYNTGGETGTQFRLPSFATPPEHGAWAVRT